jgi:hypothetical protein
MTAGLSGCRDDAGEIRAAFAAYQRAVAANDGAAAMAVTDSDSVTYWGTYFRDHALQRTREELARRSLWERVVVLVYRDQLGGEFLRSASPGQVYTELVNRRILIRNVQGLTVGPIAITDGAWAEGRLLRGGADSGETIGFKRQAGKWTVTTHDHAGYAYHQLREASEQPGATPDAIVRRAFRLFTGHDPDDALFDPPQ